VVSSTLRPAKAPLAPIDPRAVLRAVVKKAISMPLTATQPVVSRLIDKAIMARNEVMKPTEVDKMNLSHEDVFHLLTANGKFSGNKYFRFWFHMLERSVVNRITFELLQR
jgi:hypothetical protein